MDKTRYLQLSDTTMFEFIMQNDSAEDISSNSLCTDFIITRTEDNHYLTFSPVSYEMSVSETDSSYTLQKLNRMTSMNTLNHLSVPADSKNSSFFSFLDNSLKYVDDRIFDKISTSNIKAKEYAKYCQPVSEGKEIFQMYSISDMQTAPRWDTVRLYFVSGYDFSDMFGATLRLSVTRNDNSLLDLCSIFYNKSNIYKYLQYMASPIIFGNAIYNKFVEIKLPCLYDLTFGRSVSQDPDSIYNVFNIKQGTTVKIGFSYIDSDDYETKLTEIDNSDISRSSASAENNICTYYKSRSVNGTIPVGKTSSDNLGIYIAEDPDYPFIEFCATWKNMPINREILYNFNRSIPLYDQKSISTGQTAYEVDKDYEAGLPDGQWMIVHQITATFYREDPEDELVTAKTETYTMDQDFSTDQTVFKYRPTLFDEDSLEGIVMVSFEYIIRLINTIDGVQFTKRGTLSSTDINKYYAGGVNLDLSQFRPYKVYNKISETSQTVSQGSVSNIRTKYVKVFYDVTSIILDEDGTPYGNREYTLLVSRSPKTYKFVFKQEDYNGNLKYMDLTDTYFKLYCKNSAGSDIIVEPTYSDNMNQVLGELEFNLTTAVINKLYVVPEADRVLSIVAQNQDNSISTMFEMKFSFS